MNVIPVVVIVADRSILIQSNVVVFVNVICLPLISTSPSLISNCITRFVVHLIVSLINSLLIHSWALLTQYIHYIYLLWFIGKNDICTNTWIILYNMKYPIFLTEESNLSKMKILVYNKLQTHEFNDLSVINPHDEELKINSKIINVKRIVEKKRKNST